MKDAIAMFMICVSSLEGVEGQGGAPVGLPPQFASGGQGLPTQSEINAGVRYHGEALIIGGSIRLRHGGEDFQYPAGDDVKIVYRKCDQPKDHCDPNNATLNGGGSKPGDFETSGALNGVCKPFRHTKVAKVGETQAHPPMPGYTICGHKTQLTVYPDDANCGADSINYKTIGHCDNSTHALTQCWSVFSAYHDKLHAETAAYKLTPCNFNASIQPRPIGPQGDNYRGPDGQEGGGPTGQNIHGADIDQAVAARWQERMADGSDQPR